MKGSDDAKAEGHRIAVEQILAIRQVPGVRGVHIMAIGAERTVAGLVKEAGLLPRPGGEDVPVGAP